MRDRAVAPTRPTDLRGVSRLLGAFSLAVVCLGATGVPARAADAATAGVIRAVDLIPEGRLLRIHLRAAAPIGRYVLSRQGPPEKRDLVVHLPGFTSEVPTPVDVGDYLLPVDIAVAVADGAPELKLVFGNVGDSLVQVAQDGADLSILIIPPEKRSEAADAYRIGVNDMLQIDVFGHEDLNKTLKVSPSGLISFPLIGNVHAGGKTVDEVSAEITDRLGADYIQDPHVTVSVWEYLSQWVNLVGEVAQPGRYYMTGPMTLIDAITQAGGLTSQAGKEILVTRRPEAVDPASAGEVFRVNIADLFSAEGGSLNLRLRSGDIVNVETGEATRAAKP